MQHEGHPGARIDQISALFTVAVASGRGRMPTVITIHLGTNDCGQNATSINIVGIMIERMGSLLTKVSLVPHAQVYLASIIGMPLEPSWITCQAAFNARLPALAKAWVAKGMDITYVPMAENSGVCVGPDNKPPSGGLCSSFEVHPNAGALDLLIATCHAHSRPQTDTCHLDLHSRLLADGECFRPRHSRAPHHASSSSSSSSSSPHGLQGVHKQRRSKPGAARQRRRNSAAAVSRPPSDARRGQRQHKHMHSRLLRKGSVQSVGDWPCR